MTPEERLKKLGVEIYLRKPEEDRAIAVLWDLLETSGELGLIAMHGARSLSGFYNMLSPPAATLYTLTEDGDIESLHWITPMGTSQYAVFFSSWVIPYVRGTRKHALLTSSIYEMLFATGKETIMGITKQQQLLPLHEKMGYVIADQVPYLFDDQPAWFMYMTKAGFEGGKLYAVANKLKE